MSRKDSLYLLLGPEEGEKDLFIERLIKRISQDIGEKPEIHRFYPFDTDLVEVLTVLCNGTLFSKYLVIILKSVEWISKKRDIELLKEYCLNPVKQSTLLLLSDDIGKVDKRIEKMIPRENKVIFWELFENQKMGWIVSFFKKKGVGIDARAANFLLDMVENNTKQLKDICAKLALFFGKGARIEYQDIEKIIFHSKDENVFTLFEKILKRDFNSALEVLHKILLSREAEPIQLLSGILNQFRKLMAFKRLLEEGYPVHEAFMHLSIRSKKIQRGYQEGCKQYNMAELKTIIMLIAQFDLKLRSLKSPLHSTILQLFIYYAIVQGGQGAWKQNYF